MDEIGGRQRRTTEAYFKYVAGSDEADDCHGSARAVTRQMGEQLPITTNLIKFTHAFMISFFLSTFAVQANTTTTHPPGITIETTPWHKKMWVGFKEKLKRFFDSKTKEIKKSPISLPQIPTIKRDPKDGSQIGKSNDRLTNSFYLKLNQEQKTQLSIGFVNESYAVILGRPPSPKERAQKVNILLQEGSREGIYRNLTLGEEYRRNESIKKNLSDQNKQFSSHYLKVYLNTRVNWNQSGYPGLHTVKRLLVERSLEIIDAFAKRSDVNSWFAVFSEEIQKRLNWNQNHRKLDSRQRYFLWAQKMPIDILKSEVAIKIHLLMNSLQ
ncbi:MAG: hypothetical protein OXB88_00735 [Bacteriovoracales bacterium]|nr:hypothetical protein [Bacteriovoracales bacterium]